MKKMIIGLFGLLILAGYSFNRLPANETKKDKGIRKDIFYNFENMDALKMPPGWTNYFTGRGTLGKWQVVQDAGNKVLAQVSNENYGYHFDVIVNDSIELKDVKINVQFKGIAGEEDRGGGPVWRFIDADNYYIARANPLENNFRVYKVVDGDRKQLKSHNMAIDSNRWYRIAIEMKGNKIKCFIDGELRLETTDDTFREAGKVGLWTKADAVTYFDDMHIAPL